MYAFKNFIILLALFLLTACGGGGNTLIIPTKTPQEIAITKIIDYNMDKTNLPTISDYVNAGINGVNKDNIQIINEKIVKLKKEDKDSINKIQKIVDSFQQVKDTTPPSVTILGKNPLIINIGDTYIEKGAIANDYIDGILTVKIKGSVDKNVSGINIISYTATDSSGNNETVYRSIIVGQNTIVSPPNDNNNISINEVLASNLYTNLDTDEYKSSDWIELYNNENQTVDIGGFFLSDDKNNTLKWKIPNKTYLAPHGYLLIWADEKNKKANELHTNFKLSSKGETLILSDNIGNELDTIEFPKQKGDISCAKINGNLAYMVPTPNAKNNYIKYNKPSTSKKPIFVPTNGFYNTPQNITLSSKNKGTIYYTTDGSIPAKNSKVYSSPILVNKTTVIRARTLENGKFLSNVRTKTYLINHTTTLPIVSLATDSKYLFDDDIGIYTIGTNGIPLTQCMSTYTKPVNYAREWIRPVHLEYFNEQHQDDFSLTLDFAITGQCSRDYRKKSFSFELDSKYDTKKLNYKLYEDKNSTEFKDFKIRGGDYGFQIGDNLASQLVANGNLDVDYQAYRAVQMFINGEYWGVYNIREKKGADYLKSNYPNIDKKKLDIMSTHLKHGSETDYRAMMSYIKQHTNTLNIDTNYQHVINLIDENSFIDYMIVMIYSANMDWLSSNLRTWKEKKVGSKWRWMMDDVDHGFKDRFIYKNLFTLSGDDLSMIYSALLKNNTFKEKFSSRFNTYLNTLFMPENVLSIIDKLTDEKKEYMNLEAQKWGIIFTDYTRHIDRTKTFARQRRDIVYSQLLTKFALNGSNLLNITKPELGTISIDGIKLTKDYNEEYFNNAKVTLKAIPDEGHQFIGWSTSDINRTLLNKDINNSEINITLLNNTINLEAIFQ